MNELANECEAFADTLMQHSKQIEREATIDAALFTQAVCTLLWRLARALRTERRN